MSHSSTKTDQIKYTNSSRTYQTKDLLLSFMQLMPAPAACWPITDIWLTTYSMSPALLILQCRSQCSPCQTTQSRSVWAKTTSHLQSSCWWLSGWSEQPAALESQLCQESQGNKHSNELVDTSVSNAKVCDLQIIWEDDNK